MHTITTRLPVEDHRPRWLIWRITVCGLVLLFVLFPAVMALPSHEQTTAPATTTGPSPQQARDAGSCPPVDLCSIATVEQALPRLPVPPLPLLALVALILALQWQPRLPMPQHDWWWPPDRRRALLQVFLM